MEKRTIKTTLSMMERATLKPITEICLGVFDRPSQSEKIRASLVESNPKDRKSTRLNSSHRSLSRMPSSA